MIINQRIIKDENINAINEWLNNNKVSKIFLLSDKKSFEFSGSETYLQPILSQKKHVHYSGFSENPKIEDVFKGIGILKKENCDCCIGVGGGSVIDMAKLICYLKNEEIKKIPSTVRKKYPTLKRKIPLCIIPTTAGSGAESTHFAVVYINSEKHSLAHSTILPDLVNLNPLLSYSMSPYLKSITGLDALAHGIESFWSKDATLKSLEYSAHAIKLVWNNLKKSVLDNSFTAHENVVMGSNIAGKAINIAKTTASHAFSYYFTSHHNIKHGHAVALTLGKVFQFNFDKMKNSNSGIKRRFNDLNDLLHFNGNPMMVIERFISDLNIELDYSKLNINIKDELPKIIKEINVERLNNNPFKVEESDVETILLNEQ